MLAAAVAVFWLHLAIQPVLSGSMRPAFGPGSAILTRSVPTAALRPGDVVVFRPPHQTAGYAHRVMSVTGDPRHPVITTKGDANPVADPWRAQISTSTVPVVIGSVPWVGRLMVGVRGGTARIALAALAGIVFFLVGTRSILGPRPSAVPTTSSRPRHAHQVQPG